MKKMISSLLCGKPTGTLLATLVRLYILDSKLVEENYADGDYGDKGDYGKAFLLENDAGSGPYKVKEYAANSHVLCEKNTEYWAGLDDNTPEEFKAMLCKPGENLVITYDTCVPMHLLCTGRLTARRWMRTARAISVRRGWIRRC